MSDELRGLLTLALIRRFGFGDTGIDAADVTDAILAEIGRTHAIVPKTLTSEMLQAGAHQVTGEINATCCYRTGGRLGVVEYETGCYCQDMIRDLWPVLLASASPPQPPTRAGGEND